MPLNPLDWTAAPFLMLYATCVAIALLISLRRCYLTEAFPRQTSAGELSAAELALLAGGRDRAADTIVVALMEAGAAHLEGNGSLTIDGGRASRIVDSYPSAATGTVSRRIFHRAIATVVKDFAVRLAERGLLLSESEVSQQRLETLVLMGGVAAFGFAKIVVGSGRGRPVGILFTLDMVTIIIGIVIMIRPIFRTHAGRAVLRQCKSHYARAARAPIGQELALAFALTGAAVLAGTPYAAYASQVPSGSGSDGGGGGDGGGGCGGGGCGGCGG